MRQLLGTKQQGFLYGYLLVVFVRENIFVYNKNVYEDV